jgi:DNA-directed RNA polymerase specialized sigma24 family protein
MWMSDDDRLVAPARAVRELAPGDDADAFTAFVAERGPRLKQALIAALGGEVGREAAAEALLWAWEHWSRLQGMDNPSGYLYRLGKNRGIAMLRRRDGFAMLRRRDGFPVEPSVSSGDGPWVEPGLTAALQRLTQMQRVAVLLVHGWGWTYREVADHLDVGMSTVQVHVNRGLAKLRRELKVGNDA